MRNTSALARRLQAAMHRHKAKVKSSRQDAYILLYDSDGIREATWIGGGEPPDGYEGTIIYLPYNDREDR